jgi:O-antigen polymerase
VLHFAPEPRVIEKRIASARLLQLDADADAEARRYLAAFPAAYAAWSSKGALRTD